jgi:hypothetical protein
MVMSLLGGLFGGGGVSNLIEEGVGLLSGGGKKKHRRRRARLTPSELAELSQIKAILGRTAAANALPFYMGRGR